MAWGEWHSAIKGAWMPPISFRYVNCRFWVYKHLSMKYQVSSRAETISSQTISNHSKTKTKVIFWLLLTLNWKLLYHKKQVIRLVTLSNTYHLKRSGKYCLTYTISKTGCVEIQTSSNLFAMLTAINFAQRSVDITSNNWERSSGFLSFCKEKKLRVTGKFTQKNLGPWCVLEIYF